MLLSNIFPIIFLFNASAIRITPWTCLWMIDFVKLLCMYTAVYLYAYTFTFNYKCHLLLNVFYIQYIAGFRKNLIIINILIIVLFNFFLLTYILVHLICPVFKVIFWSSSKLLYSSVSPYISTIFSLFMKHIFVA